MRAEHVNDAATRAVLSIARDQAGLVTRVQALECGMSPGAIRWQISTHRWRPVFGTQSAGRRAGVYSTSGGALNSEARMWAAILVCGADAALSHESAAELHGLIDPRPRRAAVHVTVASGRRIVAPDDIVLHYSSRLDSSRHPALVPPRIRLDDTIVDLTQTARTLDRASALIADGVQRRLTTHDRIAAAIGARRKLKWRRELLLMCGVVGDGAQSLIEVRYVTNVEHAHGLPRAERQVRITGPALNGHPAANGTEHHVVDNRYREFDLVVELDGQRGHTGDGVFRDMWRDNAAVLQGDRTLRFGLDDVSVRPCASAAIVAFVLDVTPIPCGSGCEVIEALATLRRSSWRFS